MNDFLASLIRTYVPTGVGGVLTWLAAKTGTVIDQDSTNSAVGVAVVLVSGAYYTLARALEQKFPGLGWLLGHQAKPTYEGSNNA